MCCAFRCPDNNETSGIRGLGKVDKVYLDNPNIIFNLVGDNSNIGKKDPLTFTALSESALNQLTKLTRHEKTY
jgi:hypothetical protein